MGLGFNIKPKGLVEFKDLRCYETFVAEDLYYIKLPKSKSESGKDFNALYLGPEAVVFNIAEDELCEKVDISMYEGTGDIRCSAQ